MHYFGKRFLSTHLNRWVSADPLTIHGLGADLNVYVYVSGHVLKSVDPMGLEETASSSFQPNMQMADKSVSTGQTTAETGGVLTTSASHVAVLPRPPPSAPAPVRSPGGPDPTFDAAATAVANAGIGTAAFLAGIGDIATGDAALWHDPDQPLAPLETAAAARFNQWKLTPLSLESPSAQLADGFTSRALAVAPAFARGNTGILLAEGEAAARAGGAVAAPQRGGAVPVRIGQAGEAQAGVGSGPKTRIDSATGTRQYRIPDKLTSSQLLEVKNVGRLRTGGDAGNQLRDFSAFAKDRGIECVLCVRDSTKISPRSQQFLDDLGIRVDRALR